VIKLSLVELFKLDDSIPKCQNFQEQVVKYDI